MGTVGIRHHYEVPVMGSGTNLKLVAVGIGASHKMLGVFSPSIALWQWQLYLNGCNLQVQNRCSRLFRSTSYSSEMEESQDQLFALGKMHFWNQETLWQTPWHPQVPCWRSLTLNNGGWYITPVHSACNMPSKMTHSSSRVQQWKAFFPSWILFSAWKKKSCRLNQLIKSPPINWLSLIE